MREDKFRAWNEHSKKWIYFSLESLFGDLLGRKKRPEIVEFWHARNYELKTYKYTGLKDKNGKEIYGGDIFNFHPSKEWKGTEPDNPCVVFWSNDLGAWMFYVGKPEMSTLLPPSKSIEIIGNIYENPELLEKK